MNREPAVHGPRSWGHRLGARARVVLQRLLTLRGKAQRSLVGHIQLLQLGLGIVVYLLAVGGVWWAASQVSQDYFQRQAAQWLAKLDELGTPVYTWQGSEAIVDIRRQLAEFPEIAFARYYSADGSRVLAEYTPSVGGDDKMEPLNARQLAGLRALRGAEKPYVLESSSFGSFLLRASAPIWVRSISAADLLGFSVDAKTNEQQQLIGFLEVGLDFRQYRQQLLKNIAVGSGVVGLLLLFSLWVGRKVLKRALAPLLELQKPLARLAAGDVNIRVEGARHKELRTISDALNTTIGALRERDQRLRRLADHDQLTGLVNRYRFTELLEHEATDRACGKGSSALLFIDLDQFKVVNDTLGHAAGDRLLAQVAQRLKAGVREDDVVCRFGGDEFTVLAHGIDAEDAGALARTLIRALRELHFVEDGQVFSVCCSVGVSIIDSDRFTPDELLAQADMACYEAKSRGRNCFSIFRGAEDQPDTMTPYIGWSQKIRHAIEHDTFALHYQPIISMASEQAELFEVLLRMVDDHDTRLPQAFLPVAERFGLMLDIDRWVIRNALKALAQFRRSGADLVFCVNLSGHAFEDPQLVDRVKEGLAEYALPPSSVVFEITEQVAIRYLDSANRRMHKLMDLGCRFALDDFGAGFSSLTYIKRLPVDYIKIEGSFVENLAKDVIDQAMVKSIVQIARTTGKQTIAEYVQDAKSLRMLRRLGVDYAQGFYVGKPAPTLVLPGPRALSASGPAE